MLPLNTLLPTGVPIRLVPVRIPQSIISFEQPRILSGHRVGAIRGPGNLRFPTPLSSPRCPGGCENSGEGPWSLRLTLPQIRIQPSVLFRHDQPTRILTILFLNYFPFCSIERLYPLNSPLILLPTVFSPADDGRFTRNVVDPAFLDWSPPMPFLP